MHSEITNRRLGIEIEVVVPIIGQGEGRDVQDLLARVLSNHGIPAVSRGYSRSAIPTNNLIAVEHDTSLQDETRYQGLRWSKLEIKTAPMTWPELERILPPALDIIRYFGARVNHSCGLHVHQELREVLDRPLVARNLAHLWWRFHKIMYGLVAPSRKRNSYCHGPHGSEATRYDNCHSYSKLYSSLQGSHRYNGLNLMNLADRNRLTVEWRIHGGTVDFDKIRAWVLATQRWVEHACKRNCHYRPEPMQNSREGINALLVTTGLKTNSRIYSKVDKDLRQVGRFLLRRWKHFNLPRERKTKPNAAALTGMPFKEEIEYAER